MPLSEHEEQILAEIERGLSQDDPRFVQRARRSTPADLRSRRLRLAGLGLVLGFVCLLGLTFHIGFGFAGFALMLTSVVVGARAVSGREGEPIGARLRRAFSRREDDRAA